MRREAGVYTERKSACEWKGEAEIERLKRAPIREGREGGACLIKIKEDWYQVRAGSCLAERKLDLVSGLVRE